MQDPVGRKSCRVTVLAEATSQEMETISCVLTGGISVLMCLSVQQNNGDRSKQMVGCLGKGYRSLKLESYDSSVSSRRSA
jgi:hypothetical protein